LRVTYLAVQHPHTQGHEPHCKRRIVTPPRGAVIRKYGARKTVSEKHLPQITRHRLPALVPARPDAQRVPRMIVQYGKGMTPSFSYGKMSLEIHLPHIVRPLGLEPPPCLVPPGVLGAKPP